MDFFKRMFGGKADGPSITITKGSGMPPELRQLLSHLSGGDDSHRVPLFFLKDHPELLALQKSTDEKLNFIAREFEAVKRRSEDAKEQHWKAVEAYMQAHGLWPESVPKTADICLQVRDGVMYHHPHN